MLHRPLPQKRRRRTTPAELSILEDAFRIDPLPDANSRAAIANRIGDNMNPRNVQIWFQNRRQKEKKDKDIEDTSSSSHLDNSVSSIVSTEYDNSINYYHRTVPISKCYLPPLSVNASTIELATATDGRASVVSTPLFTNNSSTTDKDIPNTHVWQRMQSDPPSESAPDDHHNHRVSNNKHRSTSSTRAMPFVDPVSGTARLHSPLFDSRSSSHNNTSSNTNNNLLPPKSYSQPLPRTNSSSSSISDKSDSAQSKFPRRKPSLYKTASLDVIASRPRSSSFMNPSSFSSIDLDTSATSEEDDYNEDRNNSVIAKDDDSDDGVYNDNKRRRASSTSSSTSSSSTSIPPLARYYYSSEDGYSSAENNNINNSHHNNDVHSKRARFMPNSSLEKYYKVYFGPQKYSSNNNQQQEQEQHHRHHYHHRAVNAPPPMQSSRIPNPPPLSLPSLSQATSATTRLPLKQEKDKLPSLTARKTLFPIQHSQQHNYFRPHHNLHHHHHNHQQQLNHHTPRKYQQHVRPRHLSSSSISTTPRHSTAATPPATTASVPKPATGNILTTSSSSPSIRTTTTTSTTPDRRRQVRHAISDERDTECARVLLDLGSS